MNPAVRAASEKAVRADPTGVMQWAAASSTCAAAVAPALLIAQALGLLGNNVNLREFCLPAEIRGGHVIDRPFALQPIGGGFKGGEGLYVALGRYDKGQGLAPVDFYQN